MNIFQEIPEVPTPDQKAFSKKSNRQMSAIETVFLMTPDKVYEGYFANIGEFDQSTNDEDY